MSFRRVCDRPIFMTTVTHPASKRLLHMQLHSFIPKATRPALFLLSAAFCAAGLALSAQAQTRVSVDLGLRVGLPAPIIVEQAPPRPREERIIVSPGSGYVWIAGHHSWIRGQWVWIPGMWTLPPQPGAYWVEGRWDGRNRNWIEGYWQIPQPPPPPVVVPSQVVIYDAPPPPRQEIIYAQPSPYHVWIGGYWVWRGHRHEWVGGHWELPPRGRSAWIAPRWERRGGSYVFIEGRWR